MNDAAEDLQDDFTDETSDYEQEDQLDAPESSGEEVEASDSGPDDGATEGQPNPQKVTFTPDQQEVVNRLIGEQVARFRQTERELKERDQQLQELKQKLPEEQRPKVPPMPDPYDDDFQAKIQARDEAIRQAAAYDAAEAQREQARLLQLQEQERQSQAQLQSVVVNYNQRAQKLGVSENELKAAGQVIGLYGIDQSVAQFILQDEEGPVITAYLAKNPEVLTRINQMSPMQAAVELSTKVRSKAKSARGEKQSAPPPSEGLSGGGAPPGRRGPRGARFE